MGWEDIIIMTNNSAVITNKQTCIEANTGIVEKIHRFQPVIADNACMYLTSILSSRSRSNALHKLYA